MSDSEGESYEKQVKIVLVGDGSSGKVNWLSWEIKRTFYSEFFFLNL